MAATNPLLEAVLDFISQRKLFTSIRPDKTGKSERKVTFHLADGTVDVRTFQCDQTEFMEWWKHTSSYLHHARSAAEAFRWESGS